MILVLLGTQNNSFHRLLEQIENLIENETIKEEVIVQSGYTKYESDKMKIFDFVSQEELENLQEKANLIITHGGAGSIIQSITKNKKVIAIARNHEYGEHVNNHQREIVEIFDQKGYIIGIQEVGDLKQAIEKSKNFVPTKYEIQNKDNKKILKIIEDFIEKC